MSKRKNSVEILRKYDYNLTHMNGDLSEVLEHIFTYQKPDSDQLEGFDAVKDASIAYARVILQYCPPCEDRMDALKLLRELRMRANSAIALRGAF